MAALRISIDLLRQIIHQLCSEIAIKEIARNTKVSRKTVPGYRGSLQKIDELKGEFQSLAQPEIFCISKYIEDNLKVIFPNYL